MNAAVQDLVVVGRDAPVWLAACVMQSALKPAGLRVTVVELPDIAGRGRHLRDLARARAAAHAAGHRGGAPHFGNTRRLHARQTLPRYDRPGGGVFPRVWIYGRAYRQHRVPAELDQGTTLRIAGGVRGFLPDGCRGEARSHAGAGRGDRALWVHRLRLSPSSNSIRRVAQTAGAASRRRAARDRRSWNS